jgi:rod shape-determining protein MreC
VPDLTVVNADGLVGRVISASATTATVLLVIDRDSTVGGRLSTSMELGFLNGTGDIGGDGSLVLSLVDHTVTPRAGDRVLTWGSHDNAPYLAGIPIGTVVGVHSSPAELSQTAVVRPYVDFSSLDVVGVITAHSRRSSTVTAGGPP